MTIKTLEAHPRSVGEGMIILTSPCYKGRYYLAPKASEGELRKPYVQIGDEVVQGQPLCRIRETLTRRWQEFLILSPMRGIITERTAELEHLSEANELRIVEEGFSVGIGAALFHLKVSD